MGLLFDPSAGKQKVLVLGEGGLPNLLPTPFLDHTFPPKLTGRSQGKITKVNCTLSCPCCIQPTLPPVCPLVQQKWAWIGHKAQARHRDTEMDEAPPL